MSTMKFVQIVVIAAYRTALVNSISFSEIEIESAPTPAPRSDGRISGTDLSADEENRIYGGSDADIDKYPYMAGLRGNGSDSEGFCGGTLIAPQYVLTAGHCLEWFMYDVYVSLGSKYNAGSGSGISEQIHVVEAFHRPQYRLSNNLTAVTHDVAVLKLERPSHIKPAPLAAADGSSNMPGLMATALGWGFVNNVTTSKTVQAVDVKIITNAKCHELFTDGNIVDDSVICAGDGHGKGTCGGDSGGPLIVGGVVVGIASALADECGVLPGIYARVSDALNFINTILGGGSTGNIMDKLTAGTSIFGTSVDSQSQDGAGE